MNKWIHGGPVYMAGIGGEADGGTDIPKGVSMVYLKDNKQFSPDMSANPRPQIFFTAYGRQTQGNLKHLQI